MYFGLKTKKEKLRSKATDNESMTN